MKSCSLMCNVGCDIAIVLCRGRGAVKRKDAQKTSACETGPPTKLRGVKGRCEAVVDGKPPKKRSRHKVSFVLDRRFLLDCADDSIIACDVSTPCSAISVNQQQIGQSSGTARSSCRSYRRRHEVSVL